MTWQHHMALLWDAKRLSWLPNRLQVSSFSGFYVKVNRTLSEAIQNVMFTGPTSAFNRLVGREKQTSLGKRDQGTD